MKAISGVRQAPSCSRRPPAKRIMFGSDFPDQIAGGISAVQTIQVLSPEMKADILCHNAMRFLPLPASVCAP